MSIFNRLFILSVLVLFTIAKPFAQDEIHFLTAEQLKDGVLELPDLDNWQFKKGNDIKWASHTFIDENWKKLDSSEIAEIRVDNNGIFESWFRIKLKLDSSLLDQPLYLNKRIAAASEIYVDGALLHSFGNTNYQNGEYESYNSRVNLPRYISLPIDKEFLFAIHFVAKHESLYKLRDEKILEKESFLSFVNDKQLKAFHDGQISQVSFFFLAISVLGVMTLLFWLIALQNWSQKHLLYIAVSVTFIFGIPFSNYFRFVVLDLDTSNEIFFMDIVVLLALFGFFTTLPLLIAKIFTNRIHKNLKLFVLYPLFVIILIPFRFKFLFVLAFILPILSLGISIYYIFSERKKLKGAKWIIVIGLLATMFLMLTFSVFDNFNLFSTEKNRFLFLIAQFVSFPFFLLMYVAFWLKEMTWDIEEKARRVVQMSKEKKEILEQQNIVLENTVKERTEKLEQSLEHLKSTQAQLIQSEKMASLGELTAGIAHEIQNPLNFVNNFSEVSTELVDEMYEEIEKEDLAEVKALASDIKQNLEKIVHHGKRADGIVKGMLLHSRSNTEEKIETDVNALVDEYFRLAYHGLRAKDTSFNAEMIKEYDKDLAHIRLVPQDMGRVFLNLITNAFHAVMKKMEQSKNSEFKPTVTVSTSGENGTVSGESKFIKIIVSDNGFGIKDEIRDKIFEPFFTTKPTGQGTGLGLSLSYDIVKAHGGKLNVESKNGNGTKFIIKLPLEEK